MENIVKSVNATARIVFSNKVSFTLPFLNKDVNKSDLKNYGTNCSIKERLYYSDNTSVIGNVCTNTLSITLKSIDKRLISSNKDSDFYGYMNNTAVIYLSVTGDDGVTTNFGKYYVDAWENGASSDTYNDVNITASDLFGRIKNINIGKVRLKEHLTFSSYLISIINALNNNLPSSMQIKYIQSEIEKLDSIYSSNWQMWFNNIERNDLETVLNTIAKNTLTYIWIDRSETLRVDCLLDDNTEVPVCDVSGSTNIFRYNVINSDIYNYDGVKTTYISNVSYSDEEVLNLTNYQLTVGLNTITANLNTDKCINVHSIEFECEDGKAYCVSFYSFRDTIEMQVISEFNTISNIKVYGTVIKESYDTYINYGYKNGTLLEIENNIMSGASNIIKFTDYFANLIKRENAQIQIEGYINPQVALGNMINVIGTKLEINNSYKVTELDFKLGTSYRCNASLIRTI